MSPETITQRVKHLLASLPPGVQLLAAAKSRTAGEVREAVEAGITLIGYNYVQEAEAMRHALGDSPAAQRIRWHFIGHLQHNKAHKATRLFDMIETVDSARVAKAVDRHCAETGKVMPVLIEVNSGLEPNKSGAMPEQVEPLLRELAPLSHVRICGLMTMGPYNEDVESLRPCFRLTKQLFDHLAAAGVPNIEMRFLSMGMSRSYLVAIEEGANVARIGTKLFGERASG